MALAWTLHDHVPHRLFMVTLHRLFMMAFLWNFHDDILSWNRRALGALAHTVPGAPWSLVTCTLVPLVPLCPGSPVPWCPWSQVLLVPGAWWLGALVPVRTLQRQNAENLKQIFPEKEYRGLSPNFDIHVSVSELYIPTIGPPVLL